MKLVLFFIAFSLLSFTSCEKRSSIDSQELSVDGHTSQNSLDWSGEYEGTLRCGDCEGIEIIITLTKDKSFKRETVYLGKSSEVFIEEGSFSWNDAGNTIILDKVEDSSNKYFVGENSLIQLDMEGERITGDLANNYILRK